MRYTQFLSFEICRECNYEKLHDRCPSGKAYRYGRLDTSEPLADDAIVDAVQMAYRELGFFGHVAWHYYNEPTLAWDRMIPLMSRILGHVPEARFTLWTNGSKLTPGLPGLEMFDQVWISNYKRKDWDWVRNTVRRVVVLDGSLDGRLTRLDQENRQRCLRPFNELVVDHYGNGHLCCMDFRGECALGNVRTDGFFSVVEKFIEARTKAACQPMAPDAPRVCLCCIGRQNGIVDLVVPVAEATRAARPWHYEIRETT